MNCCPHCRDSETFFSEFTAKRDLRKYRRKGPLRTTRMLLEALRARGSDARTLLDVGGGVGAIQHELLDGGLTRAVHVDASRAYLKASAEEATRRGHQGKIEYRFGDFVDLAPTLPEADIVTLDRVVCCYPHIEPLVEASARKAERLYGLAYPRERRAVRAFVGAGNLYFRIRRTNFRSYVHPRRAILAVLARSGFRLASANQTYMWHVEVFERA